MVHKRLAQVLAATLIAALTAPVFSAVTRIHRHSGPTSRAVQEAVVIRSEPGRTGAGVSLRSLSGPKVVLYGDSLAWQSQGHFKAALVGAGITQVTTRTFGGTAICDWLTQMRADARSIRPEAVVVEFSGNDLTPCMKSADGRALSGTAYFKKYADDASTVLGIFVPQHALVFFAGAPIGRAAELTHDQTTARLHAIYMAAAHSSSYGRYVDAGDAVLDHGHWTETLPCLPEEPCTGGRDASGTPVNVVRAPDGGHFCPGAPAAVRGVTPECTVWSSGSWRFGNAMAAPVIAEFIGQQA